MFAREGYPFILGGALLTAITCVMALKLRSWPLWLFAFVIAILTLGMAWFFRDPTRAGERGAHVAIAPAHGPAVLLTTLEKSTLGPRTVAGQMVIADLPVL